MKKSVLRWAVAPARPVIAAVVCSVVTQYCSPLFAANQYWLGNQSDPLFASIKQGSFFDANNWNNTVVPGSADTVFLGIDSAGDTFDSGSGNSNFLYSPNYINFGNFQLSAGLVPGGTASVGQLNVVAGSWTFDFGSGSYDGNHNPAASTGSLVVATGFQVGGTNGAQPSLTITDGSSLSVQNANIGDDNTGNNDNGSLTVNAGASLIVSSALGVGNLPGSNGVLKVDGASAIADIFVVGSAGQGQATFTNGASFQLVPDIGQNRIFLGLSSGSSGTLNVTNGSTLTGQTHNNTPAVLTVGGVYHTDSTGTGALNITGGATVSVDQVVIADGPSIANRSTGAVLVSGSNSSLQASSISVGNGPSFNSASMHVASGAIVSAPFVQVGNNGFSASTNTANPTTASGNATLIVDSGGQLLATEATAVSGVEVSAAAGQSVFTADGANTLVTGSFNVTVFGPGTASATFSNGAHLDGGESSSIFEVLSMNRSTASSPFPQITFTGNGTLATGLDEVLIHAGILTISNGATVTSAARNSPSGSAVVVGDGNFVGGNGQGQVIVTGAGSTLNANGHLVLGFGAGSADSGQLLIQSGGIVNCVNAYLGRSGPATGTLSVTGAGSSLHASGSMYVGGNEVPVTGSTGNVTLANGGAMTIADKLAVWAGSSVDVRGGDALVGAGAMPASGNLRIGSGGTLSGGGTILGNVLNDGGIVAPADDPETLTIQGDYSQSTGKLVMEIAGPGAGQYDQLVVTGNTTLGGTLELDLLNGFVPSPGTTFDLFNFSHLSAGSQFSAIDLPAGVNWNTSELLTNGIVSVSPEPSSLALLGLGGIAILRRRRAGK